MLGEGQGDSDCRRAGGGVSGGGTGQGVRPRACLSGQVAPESGPGRQSRQRAAAGVPHAEPVLPAVAGRASRPASQAGGATPGRVLHRSNAPAPGQAARPAAALGRAHQVVARAWTVAQSLCALLPEAHGLHAIAGGSNRCAGHTAHQQCRDQPSVRHHCDQSGWAGPGMAWQAGRSWHGWSKGEGRQNAAMQ